MSWYGHSMSLLDEIIDDTKERDDGCMVWRITVMEGHAQHNDSVRVDIDVRVFSQIASKIKSTTR